MRPLPDKHTALTSRKVGTGLSKSDIINLRIPSVKLVGRFPETRSLTMDAEKGGLKSMTLQQKGSQIDFFPSISEKVGSKFFIPTTTTTTTTNITTTNNSIRLGVCILHIQRRYRTQSVSLILTSNNFSCIWLIRNEWSAMYFAIGSAVNWVLNSVGLSLCPAIMFALNAGELWTAGWMYVHRYKYSVFNIKWHPAFRKLYSPMGCRFHKTVDKEYTAMYIYVCVNIYIYDI